MNEVEFAKQNPEIYLEENRGLLEKLVTKFYLNTPKFSRDDLFQEATISALNAIDKYDEDSRAKLSTYVYLAVKRSCRDYVRRNKHDLYVTNYQQHKDWLESQAENSDDSPESYKMYGKFGTTESPIAIRLDESHGFGSASNGTLGDTIPSGELSVLDSLIKDEQIEILKEEMATLPERERDIIHARYWNGATLEEIASTQGCTRQRIDVISKRALNRLSTKVKKRLEDELFI